jgi:SAM-dependent methyltransferase
MQSPSAYEPMRHQKLVNSHFTQVASYWAEVYQRGDDVNAVIFRERLRVVLELVERIGLPRHARVLEIGCGAGYTTAALAGLGYAVDAIDAVEAMVDATCALAAKVGLATRVTSAIGDVHALPFPDATFGLVVAIGVLPWLPSTEKPVREICRVLRPGGCAILSVDNRWGLRQFVEPFTNPLLMPAKEVAKGIAWPFRRGRAGALNHTTSRRQCDALLRANGMEKLEGVTLGFGPFSFFNRAMLPNPVGLKLHRWLQDLADRDVPLLRAGGYQYLVLARKLSPRI